MSTQEDRWLPVMGWEGLYEVSDSGQVKGPRALLKPWPINSGRLQVHLSRPGQRVARYVHTLVLEAFVGPRPNGHEGCHRDDVPSNNTLDNLYWGTRAENEADKVRRGAQSRGEGRPAAKLHDVDIPNIRARLAHGESYPAIAADYGVDRSLIGLINRGKVWTHVNG